MIPEGRAPVIGNGNGNENRNETRTVAAEGEDELAQALEAYLAAVEAGEPVDPEEWVNRHPAIADRLRACLKGLHLVEAAAEAFATAEETAAQAQAGAPGGEGPRLGDFRVVRELGRGGMGVVYEAEQRSLGRRVALKVLPFAAAIDPRQIARFRVEAQAASQLHHAHIVPVYSVGCDRGVHYYAMQLIDGLTLAELIAELGHPGGGPANPSAARARLSSSTKSRAFCREVARLGLQAAEALEHAHQQGVLHRDIKPSNLIIGAQGHLWVTDFGLARFQGEGSLTATGDLLGTLRYMSPEQALANRAVVDQRTDVYSLGATLYELVTLRPAFKGTDRQDLLRLIAQEEPRPPHALNPAVPADLETIVLKAMAKEPVSRYNTAQELADDLRRYLADQPILARRPGLVERAARWTRRHVAVVLTVVPLLAIMVAGLTVGIVLVLTKQAEIRRKQAEIERSQAEARQQRDEARRAVNVMYTQIAEDWLGRQPNLQPLQRDFLLKALAYYQAFALENDPDPAVRAEAGVASLRVGEIQRKLGRHTEAERAYRQAITVLESISSPMGQASPDTAHGPTKVLESLSKCYGGLGELLGETNRTDEANDALRRAVSLTQTLIDATPDAPTNRLALAADTSRLGTLLRLIGRFPEAEAAYRQALVRDKAIGEPRRFSQAGTLANLGIVLTRTGRPGEARQSYRRAVDLYQSLVEAEPGAPVYRRELAGTLLNLGVLLANEPGGIAEAERAFRRALELYHRLSADAPGVPQFRQELTAALTNLGSLLAATGRPAEAESLLRRAVGNPDALAIDRPEHSGDRGELALARFHLASLLSARGECAEASRLLQQAIRYQQADLLSHPGDAIGRDRLRSQHELLAGTLIRLGAHAEAATVAEDLLRDAPVSGGGPAATRAATYLTSCAALAGRDEVLPRDRREAAARSYAQRALGLLRAAATASRSSRTTTPASDPAAPFHLAWFLTTCPVTELRDPAEALRIARTAVASAPGSWISWATLGAALYRAGEWHDARDALEHATDLNRGAIAFYGFFLAMAHHQLRHDDQARAWFDQTNRWLQAMPWDEAALRLRAEAAGLLGPPGYAVPPLESQEGATRPN
jgi:tetratricopeptide (TPR) repeat protein